MFDQVSRAKLLNIVISFKLTCVQFLTTQGYTTAFSSSVHLTPYAFTLENITERLTCGSMKFFM